MTGAGKRAHNRAYGRDQPTAFLRRWFAPVAGVVGGFLVLRVGIPWLLVITPHWLASKAAITSLWILLGAFTIGVPAAFFGTVWSWSALARARRRHDRVALDRGMKCAALATSCLASLAVMELVVRVIDDWSYRIPKPKMTVETKAVNRQNGVATRSTPPRNRLGRDEHSDDLDPGLALPEKKAASVATINILVLGESSALGEPYDPWVSVGQIVGWKLKSVFPGQKIVVDVRARGGFCLEQALLPLASIDRNPDAVILFSGHNEFYTRYGWSRNVAHYAEEGPRSLLGLQDLVRSMSSTTHTIFKELDRYYGEAAPPLEVTRELVDHPVCTPREYTSNREEFERRLDSLAAYCQQIGALAILIVPGSNDGAFEPSRSVLSSDTPTSARTEFVAEFQAARAAQVTDPVKATASFRELIARHSEFAESHYRLAQLLTGTGNWSEAAREFVLARDLDALPIRCLSDFRAIFPTVARRYGCMLIDAPSVLAKISPHGILDDHLFHDAHHLNVAGAIALAGAILEQMRARRAFAWAPSIPAPAIDLEECCRHFELDSEKWATVCARSSGWYIRCAYLRYDPLDRLETGRKYEQAQHAIAGSRALDETVPRSLKAMLPILERLRLNIDRTRVRSTSH
jgi:hypothetical protein